MANADTPSKSVAEIATQTAALPARTPILIGTFGADDALRALLRLPSGKMARVAPGDRVAGLRITAISPGMVLGERRGQAMTLTMPGT